MGDICHHLTLARANDMISSLHGKKYLIKGNHDKQYDEGLFEEICDFKMASLNGNMIVLMHYPMMSWPKSRKSSIHLHGHIHAGSDYNQMNREQGIKRYDVGVDANNFIRYSLDEEAIRIFIGKLDSVSDCSLKMVGNIEELKQQDYHGKRIHIEITDEHGTKLTSKMDMGVHTKLKIDQEEYCFDIGFDDEGASLLINSKEQMFTEKLRSILKFGAFSTQYKDIYDIYYLLPQENFKKLLTKNEN